LKFASKRLLHSKNFIAAVLQANHRAIQYTSLRFKNKKSLVLIAIKQNGYMLRHARPVCDIKDVVLVAIRTSPTAIQFAHEKLRNDKEVILEAVKRNGHMLEYASDVLKQDKQVIRVAHTNINDIHVVEKMLDDSFLAREKWFLLCLLLYESRTPTRLVPSFASSHCDVIIQ
jgi:hypothetical protein